MQGIFSMHHDIYIFVDNFFCGSQLEFKDRYTNGNSYHDVDIRKKCIKIIGLL